MKQIIYFSFGQPFVLNVPGSGISLPKRKGREVSCVFRARGVEGGEAFISVALSSKVPHLFNQLFFSKIVVVVLGSVSVEELASVEDATSARFALYGGRYISSHAYGFRFDGT